MEVYTTDAVPGDTRPIASAFLVKAVAGALDDALSAIEDQARKGGASAIVGLRVAVADSTYYNPGNTYAGGGGADLGGGAYWAVYATAIKRKGDMSRKERYEALQRLSRKVRASPPLPEAALSGFEPSPKIREFQEEIKRLFDDRDGQE